MIDYEERCPACGDFIDYCQGHGELGDPVGLSILMAHDDESHENCHPAACADAWDMAYGMTA